MLKITATTAARGSIVLRIEGRLVSGWIPELMTACHVRRTRLHCVELDIGGLSFADADGIEALRALAVQGLQITNCSPFMVELMRESRE